MRKRLERRAFQRREWSARLLRTLALLWSLGALVWGAPAVALPGPGETVPSFAAKDLLGQRHESQQWQGRHTLLVVITDQHAGDEMRRWFDAAATRLPEEVHRASIISLGLPFYVSTGMLRGRAKEQVPQQFWTDTWADKDGKMARVLGLATSRQPYVLALDERGRVMASVHGNVDSPDAPLIWDALSGQQHPR
ncbi:hypothetical protein [Hyalangium gracile]|uniref:hypothetical protein n=1 Tax=Hyalangium gracile TaxID=394092 RepID=UPI001CCCAF05|nr:hypothetical protein [Hyalangium gracile]